MKLSNLKEWVTTLLGCLLMTFAVLGYYFDWPKDHEAWKRAFEMGLGFLLLWTDRRKLVEWVQNLVSKRL